MSAAQPGATRSDAPHAVRGLARWVGGVLFTVGGVAWAATFVSLATEHPTWGAGAFAWLAPTAALLGAGALAALAGRWAALQSPIAVGGAAVVAIGLVSVVPPIGSVGFAAVALGAPVLGAGLAAHRATRWTGWLLCAVSIAFLVTRPWMLGPADDPSGWARDAIEVGLALAAGGSWMLAGVDCMRGPSPASRPGRP